MVKVIVVVFLFLISNPIFGQVLSKDLEGDSIHIKLNGKGMNYPYTTLSLYEGTIKLSYRSFNLSTGETLFTDTIIVNDSVYNRLRDDIYYWFSKDNTIRSKPVGKFTERRVVWLKSEVWIGDYERKKLLGKRNFYAVAGDYEYLWSKEFEEFYLSFYSLTNKT
jgi:hypothetical protein